MAIVVGVRFTNNTKVYYFDPSEVWPAVGDGVICDTVRGLEYGTVVASAREVSDDAITLPLRKVLYMATEEDVEHVRHNAELGRDALKKCKDKIIEHKLDMKLIDVDVAFDNSKMVFYFTANGRVDFRDLVKDLASMYKTRIELRQIGARDEAKLLGGLGPCGRPICCGAFLASFQPVSIKMAKEQNLSLNPTKISGLCGRLMCCLKYEEDYYEEVTRRMPRVGKDVITPDGVGTVTSIDVLTERVKVRIQMPDNSFDIRTYKNEECVRPGQNRTEQAAPEQPARQEPMEKPARQPDNAPAENIDEEELLVEADGLDAQTEDIEPDLIDEDAAEEIADEFGGEDDIADEIEQEKALLSVMEGDGDDEPTEAEPVEVVVMVDEPALALDMTSDEAVESEIEAPDEGESGDMPTEAENTMIVESDAAEQADAEPETAADYAAPTESDEGIDAAETDSEGAETAADAPEDEESTAPTAVVEKAVESEETATPEEPTESVEAEVSAESDAPVEAEESAEFEKSVETEEPAEIEESVETEKPAEPEEPVETEEPAEPEESGETEETAEQEEPVETEETAESEETIGTEATVAPVEPAETEVTAELEEPVETEVTAAPEEPVAPEEDKVSVETTEPEKTAELEAPVEPQATEILEADEAAEQEEPAAPAASDESEAAAEPEQPAITELEAEHDETLISDTPTGEDTDPVEVAVDAEVTETAEAAETDGDNASLTQATN